MKEILKQILEDYQMPKVRVEDRIASFLDKHLAEMLNLEFYGSIKPTDPIRLVAREFPIKNSIDSKSITIDALLANRTKIFLMELKTSSGSFKESQLNNYLNLKNKIFEQSAEFLITDLFCIKNVSKEYSKYNFLIRRLREKNLPDFSLIRDVEIIYLAPEKLRTSVEKYRNIRFISFSDLHNLDFVSEEFKVITENLRHIDFLDQNKGYTYEELLAEEKNKSALLQPIIKNLEKRKIINQVNSVALSKSQKFPNYQVNFNNGTSLPYNGRTHEIFNRNGKAIHHFNQKKMGSPIKLPSLLG